MRHLVEKYRRQLIDSPGQRANFRRSGRAPLNRIVRFHMTLRALNTAILSLLLVNAANAQCFNQPAMRATVTVEACVAATFGATDAMFTYGPKYTIAGTDTWPMYKAGDTLSGTLLTVSVKISRFIWPEHSSHWTNGAHHWAKGEIHSLFVQNAPADTCPHVIPAEITVQTQPTCYDMYHSLLPTTIPLTTVLAGQMPPQSRH
jgi:hypothetical protein